MKIKRPYRRRRRMQGFFFVKHPPKRSRDHRERNLADKEGKITRPQGA
ncbi:MAG: hypothetical protein R6V34_00530 [Bacteroidales bacterium]